MRILVVDDFLTMRRVVFGQLREIGFDDLAEAGDGVAALLQLRASPFDLVISDIDMPTMGGFELLSAIKTDAKLRHLPVLMVAAEARKEDIVRCAQVGAAAYLVKPFSRVVLEEKMRLAMPTAFATMSS